MTTTRLVNSNWSVSFIGFALTHLYGHFKKKTNKFYGLTTYHRSTSGVVLIRVNVIRGGVVTSLRNGQGHFGVTPYFRVLKCVTTKVGGCFVDRGGDPFRMVVSVCCGRGIMVYRSVWGSFTVYLEGVYSFLYVNSLYIGKFTTQPTHGFSIYGTSFGICHHMGLVIGRVTGFSMFFGQRNFGHWTFICTGYRGFTHYLMDVSRQRPLASRVVYTINYVCGTLYHNNARVIFRRNRYICRQYRYNRARFGNIGNIGCYFFVLLRVFVMYGYGTLRRNRRNYWVTRGPTTFTSGGLNCIQVFLLQRGK